MVFNITEHVRGVQYLLRFWRSDGVLNLNTHFYTVVFDLFCIFRENTHERQLVQAKILYQCPFRNILDFVYGGSHFSTGVIILHVRHVKNRPLWHFFYTWDTFIYGQGSFLYDEKWPLGRFSTGGVIRRYTGACHCIGHSRYLSIRHHRFHRKQPFWLFPLIDDVMSKLQCKSKLYKQIRIIVAPLPGWQNKLPLK